MGNDCFKPRWQDELQHEFPNISVGSSRCSWKGVYISVSHTPPENKRLEPENHPKIKRNIFQTSMTLGSSRSFLGLYLVQRTFGTKGMVVQQNQPLVIKPIQDLFHEPTTLSWGCQLMWFSSPGPVCRSGPKAQGKPQHFRRSCEKNWMVMNTCNGSLRSLEMELWGPYKWTEHKWVTGVNLPPLSGVRTHLTCDW